MQRRWSISVSTVVVVAMVTWWRVERESKKIHVPELPKIVYVPTPTIAPTPTPTSSESMPPESEIAPPGPTSVRATIRDSIVFRWAFAVPTQQGLDVRLLSEPSETCEHYKKAQYGYIFTAPPKGHRLRFVLPRGPGDTFFAGHPIGVALTDASTSIHDKMDGSEFTVIEPDENVVKIESIDARKGGRLKGTLSFEAPNITLGPMSGVGSFDAEICDLPDNQSVTPDKVPTTPVAGKIGPLGFVARSVVAKVLKRKDKRYVWLIEMSSTPGLKCADFDPFAPRDKNHTVVIEQIGGSTEGRMVLGAPQPADAAIYSTDKDAHWWEARRRTWVRFDSVSFDVGGKIVGALYAGSWKDGLPEAAGSIAGRFEATVCP